MKKNKKLLFFGFNNHYGGAQRSTAEVFGRISDQIAVHVVDVYGIAKSFEDAVRANNCTYEVLCRGASKTSIGGQLSSRIGRFWNIIKSFPDLVSISYKLQKVICRVQPDIILVNDYKSLHILMLAKIFKQIPIIYYLRGNYLPKQIGATTRFLFRHFVKHFIAVSTVTKDNICKSKINPEKVSVVFNPVDIEKVVEKAKFSLMDGLPEVKSNIQLLLPGTLISGKGQICAVRALKKLIDKGYDVVLWLAGDVPPEAGNEYLTSLKFEIEKLKLEKNVFLLGWREDILSVMLKSTIVLLPSHSEGMPRSVLEAMALEKPVIATKVGGIPDLIKDGYTGLLVDAEDSEGIAVAVEKFLDSDFARQVVAKAKEYIRVYCSTQTQRSLILNVINKTC